MYMGILDYCFCNGSSREFQFFFFLRLTWEFLDFESECGGSVCWPNNKIIDGGRDIRKDFD